MRYDSGRSNMTPDATDDATFYAVLALLFAHELDAVDRRE